MGFEPTIAVAGRDLEGHRANMLHPLRHVQFVTNALGMYEFLPSSQLMSAITSRLCSDTSIVQAVCTNVLFLIAGYDSEELDTVRNATQKKTKKLNIIETDYIF